MPSPRVTIDLVVGLDPAHPQIQVNNENMPQGWFTCVQMLYSALGAAMLKAFDEVAQQSQEQHKKPLVILPSGLDTLR